MIRAVCTGLDGMLVPTPFGCLIFGFPMDRIRDRPASSSHSRKVFARLPSKSAAEVSSVKIHDISMALGESTVVWPGSRPVQVVQELHGPAQVSDLAMTSHAGTHVDAPAHFVAGATTIDVVPLDRLVGHARVVEIIGPRIGAASLRGAGILPGDIVLFKTANSTLDEEAPFTDTYVALSRDGADYLARLPVRAVGIDYLSVELPDDGFYVHSRLLEAGIPIIEGLRLAEVTAGPYFLACLPLKLQGGDGAPARAVLIDPAGLSTE